MLDARRVTTMKCKEKKKEWNVFLGLFRRHKSNKRAFLLTMQRYMALLRESAPFASYKKKCVLADLSTLLHPLHTRDVAGRLPELPGSKEHCSARRRAGMALVARGGSGGCMTWRGRRMAAI